MPTWRRRTLEPADALMPPSRPVAAPGRGQFALAACLFVFGLERGWLSKGALFVAGVVLVVRSRPRIGREGWFRLLLLAAALGSYYWSAVEYHYNEWPQAVAYVSICLVAYAAGLASAGVGRAGAVPAGMLALASGICGGAVFALLSARGGLEVGSHFFIRSAPSAWDPSTLISATVFGAISAPGMALLPTVLFAVRESRFLAWRLLLLLAAVAGLLANVVLLNRTPFLGLGAAAIACGWIFLRSPEVTLGRKLLRTLPIAGATVALAVWAATAMGGSASSILTRFQVEGLSTARYDVWWQVLSQLLDYPSGGRAFPISEDYAHNLWLDVAYDAGVMPFVLLAFFHATHVSAIAAVVGRHPSLNARLIAVAALAGFGFTAMAEPVMRASITHFALSLFMLGGLVGVARRVRHTGGLG